MYVSCHDKDNSEVSRAGTPPLLLGAIAAPHPSLKHSALLSGQRVKDGEVGRNRDQQGKWLNWIF